MRTLGVLLAVAALTGSAVGGPAQSALATGDQRQIRPDAPTLPDRIGAPDKVLQMVTVTSTGWRSTTGVLRAWERPAGGRWTVMRGPLPVVLGYAGWVIAADRVQSSGTSPAGRFTLPAAFGLSPDPGTALPYNHVDGNDWWPYEPRDPATVENRTKTGVLREGSVRKPAFVSFSLPL